MIPNDYRIAVVTLQRQRESGWAQGHGMDIRLNLPACDNSNMNGLVATLIRAAIA